MKPGIHPEYRPVVFRDASNGQAFLTRSTIHTDKTIKWEDGNEYPLYTLEISAASHPFYTGTQRMLDTAGRVERFAQRYSSLGKSEDAPAKTPAKKATSKATPKAKKATGK
ncbi:MAG: type B 50S ribosomal protein L31 [Gemmatimonadota bacterium]